MISTIIAEKTIQSRFNWHLNSCVENVQAATKETNVAHAPHHPENPLKFSQIHSKRGNMRNGGCSAGIVNIHRMFPKGRHTMNAKMMSHLKDLGITLSLRLILVQYNAKYGEGSQMKRRWRVKSVAMNCRTGKEQRIVLPSWRCFSLFKRLQLRMECCLIIK